MDPRDGREEAGAGRPREVAGEHLPSAGGPSPRGVHRENASDWANVYRTLGPRLIAVGIRRFRLPREEAEEALQVASANVARVEGSVREFDHYLYISYIRTAGKIASRRSARSEFPLDGTPPAAVSQPLVIESIAVWRALRSLSHLCQALLTRWGCEGVSAREAAREIGVSEKTVSKRLHRCIDRMRVALG